MEKDINQKQPYLKRDKLSKEIKQKWIAQQKYIHSLIKQDDDFKWKLQQLKYVAGVDVSFSGKYQNGACAGLLIWNYQTKKVVYQVYQYVKLKQDYIPGFLAFRQLPPTLQLFRKLKQKQPNFWPQLIVVDGNGILHKNQCGYASHLGVLLDIPTIGCAKTFFDIDGLHQQQVQQYCSDTLEHYGENIIIKGKSGKQWCSAIMTDATQRKAVFISIGTKISLKTAVDICLKMLVYEIPDPIRFADRNSRKMIKKMQQKDYINAPSYQMIYLTQDKQ